MQVESNPQLQAILSSPTANGSPLTAQDSQGKIQLTVIGMASTMTGQLAGVQALRRPGNKPPALPEVT